MDGFWDMGGYAAFVWPSYAIAAVVLVAAAVTGVRWLRRMERRLDELERGGGTGFDEA